MSLNWVMSWAPRDRPVEVPQWWEEELAIAPPGPSGPKGIIWTAAAAAVVIHGLEMVTETGNI